VGEKKEKEGKREKEKKEKIKYLEKEIKKDR
jgi:hypothetical protein